MIRGRDINNFQRRWGNDLTKVNINHLYHNVGLRDKRDTNKLLIYLMNSYKFSYRKFYHQKDKLYKYIDKISISRKAMYLNDNCLY